jgi:hypothetical protein
MDTGFDSGLEPSICDSLVARMRLWVSPQSAEELHGCDIPQGFVFSIPYQEPAIMEPAAPPAQPATQPAPVAVPVVAAVAAAPADQAPSQDNTTALAPQPSGITEAVVEQPIPQNISDDLTKVVGAAGGNSGLAVILALLAVAGGAAGWKFWTKLSEQKHEQKLKEMELEAQKAGLNGAQPPPCAVKQAEVDAKIAALEARVGKTERTSLALPDDFDPEEMDKRIRKLELASVKAKAKKASP